MNSRKPSYLKGALVLLVANFLVKIIGALFKVPLTYLISEDGMGLFGVSYQIYTFMFIIATAGFPVAISKMVAEATVRGEHKNAKKIFGTSIMLLSVIGIAGTAVLIIFAQQFANLIGNPDAYQGILAIAPAVLFVSIMSAYRGYFQGQQNMFPTALSEIIEALGKLVIGYILASFFMNMIINPALEIEFDLALKQFSNTHSQLMYSVSGATAGVTFGTIFAVLILMVFNVFRKKHKSSKIENLRSRRSILGELIMIAIPITIGASVSSLTSLIDMGTIMNRLVINPSVMDSYSHMFAEGTKFAEKVLENGWTATEILTQKANVLYGMYTGYAFPMFNMPLTLVVALSVSVVPAIASALANRNPKEASSITESVIRITVLFALPCAIGMSVLSKGILALVFNTTNAHIVLSELAIAIIFVSLVSVTNAVLQAYGKAFYPVLNMLIGGGVKVLMNFFLIPIWGIDAVPIATNVCYAIIVILNIFYIIKYAGIKFDVMGFIKPLIASAVMGIGAWGIFGLLERWGVNIKISTIAAIAVAGIAYVALILITRSLKRDDVVMLPLGEKIANKLSKMNLLG